MHKRSSTRDVNVMASNVIDAVTKREDSGRPHRKNPAAVALGRRGGLKGGKARAAKLSPEERQSIARMAAQARWGNSESE